MCLATHGRVREIVDAARRLVRVDVEGRPQTVSLALLAPPEDGLETWIGRLVLVHVGFAVRRTDEDELRALEGILPMP
ncbi:MAG: HypC/HybG/HupF family hydrogenase formation chaperone [Phyllobacteriaceae bacterium]|nr:HypC/HybG/HupF family hydrogenase formation chaperone [Phyllobacteriaceae bacterium]